MLVDRIRSTFGLTIPRSSNFLLVTSTSTETVYNQIDLVIINRVLIMKFELISNRLNLYYRSMNRYRLEHVYIIKF